MAKIFTTVIKRQSAAPAPPPPAPSGDFVTNERLQYDRPEVVPGQTDRNVLAVRPTELVPPQREDVIAALLVRAEETNPAQTETIRITATITSREAVPPQTDSQMLASMVYESVPTPVDAIQALLFATPELVPPQTETIRIDARVNAFEVLPTITEGLAAAVIEQDNVLPPPLVTENLTANLTGYASAVASNTGWTNPNNSLGNTTGTAATLTATASGLAGTTNNTTNGTIVLDFNNVNLGDLTISNVDLFVETQRANAGVAIAQPTSNVQWQYSLDGTNFTTFHTITAVQAKGIQTIDITALVGQDQSKLSALRIRATGSVTSGTGLGAGNTVSFFRAWMVVNAARTYA
jgi:hypothetical protein